MTSIEDMFHPSRLNAPDPIAPPPELRRRQKVADLAAPWSTPPVIAPTPLRDCSIVVERDQFTLLDTQTVVVSANPLAAAIRWLGENHKPGGVIGIKGVVRGIDLGGPMGYQGKSATAFWPNQRPISGLRIIGLTDDAGIEGVTVWDGLGGVDDVRFEMLTFWNPEHSMTPLLATMNAVHGLIQCYWCRFKPMSKNQWMGQGMKWGWRGHGPAQWDMRYCEVAPAQEHSGYGDNYQGTSYFIGITGGGNGRTFLQHTNRTTSGPSQYGDIFVQDCTCSSVSDYAGGGSDYTFSGCTGTVYVKNCRTNGNLSGSNGAMVFWTDVSNGNYVTKNGYTFSRVVVEGFFADHPAARRSLVMASGVEQFELHGEFLLRGPRPSLDLNTYYGGPIANGSVNIWTSIAPSVYGGFAGTPKVVRGNRTLTSREIDAMWANRPSTSAGLIGRILS